MIETSTLFKSVEDRMNKTLDALARDFSTLRTGRATPALLDRITVEAYGSEMPLNQVASISVPEPRLLTVQAYDKGNVKAIEKAILQSDLGINPSNDGQVIRLAFPPLTEERRKDLVKIARKMAEEARVSLRNIRRDALDELKKMDGAPEDEVKRAQEDIQKRTDRHIEDVGKALTAKEKEIMEV